MQRRYCIKIFKKFIKNLRTSRHERDLKELLPILYAVNEKEAWSAGLKAEEFPLMTAQYRERIMSGETLDSLLPEAFALVREASRRSLGERPYDVQILGSIVLSQGKIAELKTGEGKTLMIVAAAYLNALPGKGVHVVTVNDYLVNRDADWMRPIFTYLGMSVGTILSNMDNAQRKANYACDIIYGTNNEFGFDYLRDNMREDMESHVQRGHNFCVLDEIDSILIDEARTPLIISEFEKDDSFIYSDLDWLMGSLEEIKKKEDGEYSNETLGEEVIGDYELNEKDKSVSFSNAGLVKIEELLKSQNLIKGSIIDNDNFDYIHYFKQTIRAHKLYHLDVDYVVQDGKVQLVDEFTGRILQDRRYSDGLHQAIEAKERVKIGHRNKTKATITFQNYFRLYKKISGCTGTADTEAAEFSEIYGLEVVVIPTNLPIARKDEDDEVYLTEKDKYTAICNEIVQTNKKGQPMLVGTDSIEKSEKISDLLTRQGIRHKVLNAKNHAQEALIIAEAGAKGAVTVATNMAGRGIDIKLGGNPEHRARKKTGTDVDPEKYAEVYKDEYEKWCKDYKEVKSLGGLYVIGTLRHESRRLDYQLRGRSGRQGDPGRSKFFISMDDELMRLFGGESMKGFMSKIGMTEGEPIYHPWLNKSIENAQKKVEAKNFKTRKYLLEYDDILNQQRKFIYGQRDAILKSKNLKDSINDTTLEMVATFIDEFKTSLRHDGPEAMRNLVEDLKTKFGYILKADEKEIKNLELLEKRIVQELEQNIIAKEEFNGPKYLNDIIRENYLTMLDRKWTDHLENMKALEAEVYQRSYAQTNPLTEYKVKGFHVFETMIDNLRKEIASRIHLIRITDPAIEELGCDNSNAYWGRASIYDKKGEQEKAEQERKKLKN